jgi:hypothetical protein
MEEGAMTITGSRLAFTNVYYWMWVAAWPVVLGALVLACLREESAWRFVPLAIIAFFAVLYGASAIRFARPRLLVDDRRLRYLGRHGEHDVDMRDVEDVLVVETIGDAWASAFMPRTAPELRTIMLLMQGGESLILDELIGTPGPTRALAARVRELVGEAGVPRTDRSDGTG